MYMVLRVRTIRLRYSMGLPAGLFEYVRGLQTPIPDVGGSFYSCGIQE